ncbi:MAG TPA: response regulator [Blastocatellia bacterium]|nr:response regulator [Blastocatellia bacterium]
MQQPIVLIVEDSDDIRELYAFVLARDGFDVYEAADGIAALRLLDSCRPAVLVTDIRIPVLSGIDLIHCVRGIPEWANLPIIAISSCGGNQLEEAAVEGATITLRKPLEPQRLLLAVSGLLSGEYGNRQPGSFLARVMSGD